MYHRKALRAAALGLALALASSPLSADAPFDRTANGGVYTLTPEQAAAMGVPGADRIGFIDILAGGIEADAPYMAGDRFDADALLSMTEDDDAIRGFFNGDAGRADLVYGGFPFDPLGDTQLQAHRDIARAVAFAFRERDGPVVFHGAQASVFDGAQTQGAFDGIRVGGGGAVTPGRDDGFDVDVPLPTALVFLFLGIVALYLSRYRFV